MNELDKACERAVEQIKVADTTQNYVRTDGMIFLRMELHSAKSVVKS